MPVIGRPPTPMTSRPNAETTPVVRVLSRPNGLPMATTLCPTSKSAELPTSTGLNFDCGASTLSTAKSFSGSAPTKVASKACAPRLSVTLALAAPLMT
eukprot:CAMPEP_0115739050 /NCGR_PEP_ID=MMETSP0272-20121206/88719_1 /TAXON_ID=71861 /ORGANISM="Scrippsiella trochoidea, Strain CCMP3099" /LENGTH=97 /DNA_ID=CAMNT_0003183543 /DNA_START=172 /DNA_END=465 /DNA_ORIENTATION=+